MDVDKHNNLGEGIDLLGEEAGVGAQVACEESWTSCQWRVSPKGLPEDITLSRLHRLGRLHKRGFIKSLVSGGFSWHRGTGSLGLTMLRHRLEIQQVLTGQSLTHHQGCTKLSMPCGRT